MATQHHGDNMEGDPELVKLFRNQQRMKAVRQWPNGRMGGDDDGKLAYAIATDQKQGVILIQFPKPIEWIGLDLKAAQELRDQLSERIMALRGIEA